MPAPAAAGVAYDTVARVSVQYVKVSPDVDPAVTAGSVRLAVAGEQTAAGLVITKVGVGLTVTVIVKVPPVQLPDVGVTI